MKQNFTVRRGALDGDRGIPERCPAPQFSQSRHGSRRDSVGDESDDTRARDARRRSAFHPDNAQCRLNRGRRTISVARQARLRGTDHCERWPARELGQRPTGRLRLSVPRAVVPILLEPLIASFCQAYPEVEVENRGKRGTGRSRRRGVRRRHPPEPVHRRRYGHGAADAAVPLRGRRQPGLSARTQVASAHR